ncbi:aspartate/glutamate racemase family protein [Amycolatopsis orientalis]|uniref:aspartate/glutamate racemase family protein n=1 Tax=Amycolatopsis orientalis TaxID=31958 RepID=UPI0003A9AF73|nr:aspartate/glutamate racemase family protein [Amycolatopsis orientalis]
MAQRIMMVNPWGVGYMDEPAREVVSPHLHDSTELAVTNLGEAAPPLPWPAAEASGLMVERARQAEKDGFGAVVIGCCADPFLDETRAAVSIPVVGVTEAVCSTAKNWGKLAILARRLPDSYLPLIPTQGNFDFWIGKARQYGLSGEQFTTRGVAVPAHPDPETLDRLTETDPGALRDRTLDAMANGLHEDGLVQAKSAVEEDGAKALFFACAFWSRSIDELGDAASAYGAPVINPLVCAATYAEHLLESKA